MTPGPWLLALRTHVRCRTDAFDASEYGRLRLVLGTRIRIPNNPPVPSELRNHTLEDS